MYRIGWFSSGRGSGSRDLLATMQESIQTGNVQAKIGFVFCNREPGQFSETDKFLEQVNSYDIPLVCFSSGKFREGLNSAQMPEWRMAYDREVMRMLGRFEVDLCVLAGYMLIVGPEMCRQYKLINLHPAEPGGPKGTWREVIWELIEKRAERSGVMMHLATPELDEGPPVTYCRFSIRGEPFDEYWQRLERESPDQIKGREGDDFELFKLIRQHGLKREFPLIVATVKAFSEGKVSVQDECVIDSSGIRIPGYDLSDDIERMVS